jgi:7,8-dihydroneopterin aldolase/epimerase/oxygenase
MNRYNDVKIDVFLKDFIIEMQIGIFDHEKGRTQRIRWSVAANLNQATSIKTDSIDSTFSYDDIVLGIKNLANRGHINLLETAAEYLAQDCLKHSCVQTVHITVEKLDIYQSQGIPGVSLFRAKRNDQPE